MYIDGICSWNFSGFPPIFSHLPQKRLLPLISYYLSVFLVRRGSAISLDDARLLVHTVQMMAKARGSVGGHTARSDTRRTSHCSERAQRRRETRCVSTSKAREGLEKWGRREKVKKIENSQKKREMKGTGIEREMRASFFFFFRWRNHQRE